METINTSQNIIIPKEGDNTKMKSQELIDILNSVSSDDIANIGEEIGLKRQEIDDRKKHEEAEVYKSVDEIIRDIKEKYVEVTDGTFLLSEGKNVHLKLPAVGDFEGFDFTVFISDLEFPKYTIEENDTIKENLCGIAFRSDMFLLRKAISKYLKALGVNENYLGYAITRVENGRATFITNCVKKIIGLNGRYWTKTLGNNKGERLILNCEGDYYDNIWSSDKMESSKLLIRKE